MGKGKQEVPRASGKKRQAAGKWSRICGLNRCTKRNTHSKETLPLLSVSNCFIAVRTSSVLRSDPTVIIKSCFPSSCEYIKRGGGGGIWHLRKKNKAVIRTVVCVFFVGIDRANRLTRKNTPV